MHLCIQFSYRFWTGFGMNFLSEVQMFHNAETLRKLFSPQFLQCFVNVALFRTRTEIIDNLLWNAKKQASKFNGKSIKNRSKIVFFESSESDRVSDPILGAFWHHFGTILGGLGVHLPPFWPSWTLRGRFLGVCSAVLEPLGALQDLQTSILIDFGPVWSDPGAILEPFWTPGTPFWTFRPPFWSPRCPIWEAQT